MESSGAVVQLSPMSSYSQLLTAYTGRFSNSFHRQNYINCRHSRGEKAVVFLGAHDIRNPLEPGQKRIFVGREDFIIHPTWNPKFIRNDIALIRIPDTIEFSDTLQPIELPTKSVSLDGKFAMATGWGKYSIGKSLMASPNISKVLRFVNVEIVNDMVCRSAFPSTYTSSNVCTSGRNGKSTCMGDSGGPLIVRKKKSKKYILIGITSFGSIFGCNKGFPSAYTRVSSFTDWIESNSNVFRSGHKC